MIEKSNSTTAIQHTVEILQMMIEGSLVSVQEGTENPTKHRWLRRIQQRRLAMLT